MSKGTEVALPEQWRRDFDEFSKSNFNVLVPRELGPLPPYHTPQMAVVHVNPDPEAGDIYPLPGGKFGLSKVALDKISMAAAVNWVPELSGRTDDGSDPNLVSYRMVGKVKDLNGQWRTILGTKEVNLVAIEQELREAMPRRDWVQKIQDHKKRVQAIEDAVTKEMIQFRKHRVARAQSGAMTRAIRSAFAIRSNYTKEALSRPFVLAKVVFTPDYSNPEVVRFLLAEATGTLRELYGSAAQSTGQLPPALPAVIDEPDEPETAGAAEPIKDAETEPPGDGGETGKPEQLPPPDPDEVRFQEAQGDAKKEQEALIRLIARKAYKTDKLLKPLDQFSKEQRAGFLRHLLTMKDVQPPELPWK